MKVILTRPDVTPYINQSLFLLAVTYPFVTHFSVIGERVWPSLGIIYAMLGLLTLEAFVKRSFLLQLTFAIVLGLAIFYAEKGTALLNFYPIVIVGSLFVLFTRSLLPGETPMITLFAAAIEKPLSEKRIAYTRKVTQVWSIMFLLMLAESILLAVFASQYTWSLFTNFINYIFIAALFVGEYFFRIYHLKDEEQLGFFEFANQMRKLRISNVLQQKKS